MSEWIRLGAGEMFLLWWAADLGEPPPVLGLPRPGSTPARRAEYAAQASELLQARGLGTVHEPVPVLRSALRRVATAGTKLDLHVYGTGTACALGALGDRAATVVVRTGDEIRLRAVTPGRLLESLLEVPPPLPAAPGLPANVSVADYADACGRGEVAGTPGFVQVLRAAGLREPDTTTLVRAITTREGGGRLGSSRHRKTPVTWVDTPAGRYAMRERGGWVTVTPADGARLTMIAKDLLTDR